MYGEIKSKDLLDGSFVGRYAGIVYGRNLAFLRKLCETYPKLTETALANRILNSKLDEYRELHERMFPELKPEDSEIDDILLQFGSDK